MRAGWMRPSCEQLLERHPGDLAADAVEAGEDDRVRRVVDDEVDAGEVLQRADVAALAADDAALHVVGRELDDRDGRLGGVAGGEALHARRRGSSARAARRRAWSPPRSGATSRAESWRDLVLDLLAAAPAWPATALRPATRSSCADVLARGARRVWPRAAARAPRSRSSSSAQRASSASSRRCSRSSSARWPRRGRLVARRASARRCERRAFGAACGAPAPCARAPGRAPRSPGRRRRGPCQHDRRDHDFHCVSSPRRRGRGRRSSCSVMSWERQTGPAAADGDEQGGGARPPPSDGG